MILSSSVLPLVGRLYRPDTDRADLIAAITRSKLASDSGKSCAEIYETHLNYNRACRDHRVLTVSGNEASMIDSHVSSGRRGRRCHRSSVT